MTQKKLTDELNKYLNKLGDIVVIKYIDYYYRETYEGSIGWKVREEIKLTDIIKSNPTPLTEFGKNFGARELLKFLSRYSSPIEVNIKYEDTYKRFQEQNEANKDKEQKKEKELANYLDLFTPYRFLDSGLIKW